MSIPNLIPHKTLYISGYIYSYYAFVFIFEFPEHISKHILQFHASRVNKCPRGAVQAKTRLSLKPWGIALKFLFLHHENILFPND